MRKNGSERGARVHRRTNSCCAAAVAAAALVGGATSANAALTWDPNGAAAGAGGSGVWDAIAPNWFDGTNWINWNNAAPTQAVFTAPAGTVTLNGGSIDAAAGISLGAGYTFENGTLNLANGTITATAEVTSFNLPLSGTGNLTLSTTNGAVIELNASNNWTGGTTIAGGIVRIGQPEGLRRAGTGSTTVTGGAVLQVNQVSGGNDL